MACNCNNNSTLFRSLISNVAVNAGSTAVVLTPDVALTPINENKVAFIVTTSIPITGMSLPAQIVINGTGIPIYDRFGNIIYGANIRSDFEYKGFYGTNGAGGTAHIQIVNYPIRRCCK